MSVDYRAIGKRIKQKRKDLEKTQDYLAESLSVSVGYISQIERGITKVSLDTLSEIATHLNCDISELITGTVPSHQDYLNEEFAQVYDRMDTHQKNILLEIAHVILHY